MTPSQPGATALACYAVFQGTAVNAMMNARTPVSQCERSHPPGERCHGIETTRKLADCSTLFDNVVSGQAASHASAAISDQRYMQTFQQINYSMKHHDRRLW